MLFRAFIISENLRVSQNKKYEDGPLTVLGCNIDKLPSRQHSLNGLTTRPTLLELFQGSALALVESERKYKIHDENGHQRDHHCTSGGLSHSLGPARSSEAPCTTDLQVEEEKRERGNYISIAQQGRDANLKAVQEVKTINQSTMAWVTFNIALVRVRVCCR